MLKYKIKLENSVKKIYCLVFSEFFQVEEFERIHYRVANLNRPYKSGNTYKVYVKDIGIVEAVKKARKLCKEFKKHENIQKDIERIKI